MERGFIETPGGTFHYLHAGDPGAPLVLILHGFPDHPPTFEPLMASLADAGYRAIAPWMRGYHPSVIEGPYDLERIGLDVMELGQALSPERPVYLVGHDWGAAATCIAAAQAPELFAGAILLALPHPLAFVRNLLRHPTQLLRSAYMFFFQLPRVPERLLSAGNFAIIDMLWRLWSPAYRLPEHHRRELRACLEASMPAPLEYYRAMLRPPGQAIARLREIKGMAIAVPTLHIHGADDGCVAPASARTQKEYFIGPFHSVTLPGLGHFLHIEDPDQVAERIIEWLAYCPLPPPLDQEFSTESPW